ncbi:hypothetical protein [Streptomyces galbus]|uniref:Uncharacterized protein n=1 Tax=Streptomyces galbus TaxID=33898 RepID=A0A4U5W5L0_STRGB|nr:hypothetical protein [Streptomyces galbus]TKS95385.1 hypothetical protein E4U92_35410 [Streptomyces galbus]
MKNRMKTLALAGSALLLAAGVGAGGAEAASATPTSTRAPAACFDVLHSYSKPSGYGYYPTNGTRLTTTSRCADINISPRAGAYIAVCFHPSSGSEYCNGYTWAPANQYTVVASGVRDGTQFYFAFRSTAASSGGWAA